MTPIASSLISGGANIGATAANYFLQKKLTDYQYQSYINAAKQAGATPAAIAAGITKAPSNTPTVSTGGNPFPDLANSQAISSQIDLNEMLKNLHQSERDINLMRLNFEPKRYFADIQKSYSEVMKNIASSNLDKGMLGYYNELKESIILRRPWEIKRLQQGLQNDLAEFNKLLQDTRTSKALEGKYDSESRYFDASSDNVYADTLNKGLEGFRLQFENHMRAAGWNPSQKPWDNVLRLSFTDPNKFKSFLDNSILFLNLIDDKLQENIGEHYKRNIMLIGGLHYLRDQNQKARNASSYRFHNIATGIGSLIPFTGGSHTPVAGFNR